LLLPSKAGGGSFEDGAVQAGMVFLYNFNKILTAEDAEQAANANARALELVFGSNAAPIKIDGRTRYHRLSLAGRVVLLL
jgi:hypothetical protein